MKTLLLTLALILSINLVQAHDHEVGQIVMEAKTLSECQAAIEATKGLSDDEIENLHDYCINNDDLISESI